MIKQLVINGCSYMEVYSRGLGHVDLASRLGIDKTYNLAYSGCANSRIIRSTLKHSYSTDIPTLYVIGLTFMSRWELPINNSGKIFEGRWVNPQAFDKTVQWQINWSSKDTETFKELQFKSVVFAHKDQLEDLMYRLISMLHDLRSRGHQALIYNQADDNVEKILDNVDFGLLHADSSFVHALAWRSILWQQQQGVPTVRYPANIEPPPPEFRHIMAGKHHLLNEYLTNYIREHKILA